MVSYTRLNVAVLTFITTCFICFGIYLMFESITNYIGESQKSVESSENSIENTIKNTTTNNTKNQVNNTIKNTTTNIINATKNQVNNTINANINNTTNNTITNATTNTSTNTTINMAKPASTVNKISNVNMWRLVIQKINLDAPIAEGTSKGVMDEYIGHFENTATLEGNIGLAAHNRGYPVNYFQNIKQLEEGDVIEYFYGNTKKEYKVETVTIISDTDWTYLAQTKENKITLITCVEDQPNYRRCIQAVEIK